MRITTKTNIRNHGTLGSSEAFIMTKTDFDKIVKEAAGDIQVLEKRLGFDEGTLDLNELVAAYIQPDDLKKLNIPSGNEAGVNSNWLPGGYTSGGTIEAVADLNRQIDYTILDF